MVILAMGQEYNEKMFAIHTYHPSSMVCGWVLVHSDLLIQSKARSELRATTSTLMVVGTYEGKGWWVDMKHFF